MSREDLSFTQVLGMQRELWEKHKDEWSPLEPEYARNHFLWMIGEIGEVLDIVKKCGEAKIMQDASVKAAFTEEMCDVLMYMGDVLMRYDISAQDISRAFRKKHAKNMERSYKEEERAFAEQL